MPNYHHEMTETKGILDIQREGNDAKLVFSGRLEAKEVASVWDEAVDAAKKAQNRRMRPG